MKGIIMSSHTSRLSITLDEEATLAINSLAQHRNISKAAAAKQLINEALELHEDLWLSRLAAESLKEPYNPVPHEEVKRKALLKD